MNDDLAASMVQAAGKQMADWLFRLMLERKIAHSGGWIPAAWKALLDLEVPHTEKAAWYDRMKAAAPRILEGVWELRRWVSAEPHLTEMARRLSADLEATRLIRLAAKHRDVTSPAFEIEQILARLMDLPSPSLLGTIDEVLSGLKKLPDAPPSLLSRFERIRSDYFDNDPW